MIALKDGQLVWQDYEAALMAQWTAVASCNDRFRQLRK